MKEVGNYEIYTADDEEPNCNTCDYCCGGFDCENLCGAVHFWFWYQRTERIEESVI